MSSAASARSSFRAREQSEERFAVADPAERAHQDIVERREISDQSQLLRDVADQGTKPPLVEARELVRRKPLTRPVVWFQDSAEHAQQSRFAGARRAHDDGVFSRRNRQRNIAQHPIAVAIGEPDSIRLESWSARRRLTSQTLRELQIARFQVFLQRAEMFICRSRLKADEDARDKRAHELAVLGRAELNDGLHCPCA